jgi:hypothetical protein
MDCNPSNLAAVTLDPAAGAIAMNNLHRLHRTSRLLVAILGATAVFAFASCTPSSASDNVGAATQRAATVNGPEDQAIFEVLTQLPSSEVNIIVSGLAPQVRDDLNAIVDAVVGSIQH